MPIIQNLMESKEVRDRIRDNINGHKNYLSNKEAIRDPTITVHPSSTEPLNDYETAKHKVTYRQFESEVDPIVEDQLKREQQKCKILEERLRNKEIFITQLKEFQSELTHAFEESQSQLSSTKLRFEELRLETLKLRDSNEQLEKLILHMEHAHLQRFEKLPHQPSPGKFTKKHSDRSYQLHPLVRNQEQRSYSHRQLPSLGPTPFSRQTMDLAEAVGCKAEEVSHQAKRIGKFLRYLIQMVTACSTEIKSLSSLKQRLKFCWKWLKGIVKESAQIREYGDQVKAERQKLQKLLKAATPNEITFETQRLLTQTKQYLHVIKLAMDFHRMPDECTAKELEQFFKERLQRR